MKPLYDLFHVGKDISESWTVECQRAFDSSKLLLTIENVLTHYNLKRHIYVTCGASSFGVGGVLSHKIDGHDRPIMFAF